MTEWETLMLQFDSRWRFDSPGEIPRQVIWEFSEFIGKIAGQYENRQWILEHFKGYFASANGSTAGYSTSESWAQTDLDNLMQSAGSNAPLFIEAFYDGCTALLNDKPDLVS